MKKKIVVLSGAGISAESGLKTFRDSDGLWEGHNVTEVATPEGWERDPQLVLNFYNERRKQAKLAQPNSAHRALQQLEARYEVQVITQNVDHLHEAAGSSNVIHLHGNLFTSRSSIDENLIFEIPEKGIEMGDLCPLGSQLRPNIVWFGEAVPMIEVAAEEISTADIVIIIGTSLQVYPAAGLIDYRPLDAEVYLVDPNARQLRLPPLFHVFNEKATNGMELILEKLLLN
ncbi:NAD-dependent deacylase [Persicobacter diffluens]|uniref:NAD-dependent protein deacylase n=1 Tax=Persicobacter diffluens TaxID=981 RepID=A0AAN4VWB3_9BACT|nr:NAD-dependent protein deacylase [Persicobacter diffluens]